MLIDLDNKNDKFWDEKMNVPFFLTDFQCNFSITSNNRITFIFGQHIADDLNLTVSVLLSKNINNCVLWVQISEKRYYISTC